MFTILSIDGGGARGIYPATLLACLEKTGFSVYDNCDMIAGTSTGAIIAAGIASQIPAADIVAMYREHAKDIFRNDLGFLQNTRLAVASLYENKHLKRVLNNVLKNTPLREVKKPLLIPVSNVGNGRPKVFKSAPNATVEDDVLLKDAVMASCSAPTFFDPHAVPPNLLADGGLWANNPALVAVLEAHQKMEVPLNECRVLTLGCGYAKKAYDTETAQPWGVLNGWKHKEFIGFLMSLQSHSTNENLARLLQPEQILRIDFESDEPLPIDDPDLNETLVAQAIRDWEDNKEAIVRFLG
jgi:patatin-like phospholipase/acyl hydrolase